MNYNHITVLIILSTIAFSSLALISPVLKRNGRSNRLFVTSGSGANAKDAANFLPSFFEDVIPFVSEHVQKSDQILLLGANTDFALSLALDGYGMSKLGCIHVVDASPSKIDALEREFNQRPELAPLVGSRFKFSSSNLDELGAICKQSSFDAAIDYGALDELVKNGKRDSFLKCIDFIQQSLRLGNLLVCLSKFDKETFCPPFDERFGWIQELDGDPGQVSAWYRGKSSVAATDSNFQKLGLKMYVYTNTDNC